MAGGLFVFVRTAPPGGCALAITAGQYRPPMAHGPLRKSSGGPFLFIPLGSIAGRDSVFASLSRPRRVSTRRLSLTALAETRRAGLFLFYPALAQSRRRRCHAGLRSGMELVYMVLLAGSSDRFSMLFVFLCPHADRAGNRAVMRTCNI
jgi:hypothetical protein